MLFKRRKKLFEVVCYEEGEEIIFIEVVCYEEGEESIFIDVKLRCNGLQFMTVHKAILRNALKKAFDADPDFGRRMAYEIMLVVHAALEERMEDPRDL